MKTLFRRAGLAALALALVLGACGDSTGSTGTDRDHVAFSYVGSRSGSFRAQGEFRNDKDSPSTFAAAYQSDSTLVIFGYHATGSNLGDVFIIHVHAARGSRSCFAGPCTVVSFFRKDQRVDTQEYAAEFFGLDGTTRITELTAGRARGTFATALRNTDTQEMLETRFGSFDVAILPKETILGGSGNQLTPEAVMRLRSSRVSR
jgi:hypothetical protein